MAFLSNEEKRSLARRVATSVTGKVPDGANAYPAYNETNVGRIRCRKVSPCTIYLIRQGTASNDVSLILYPAQSSSIIWIACLAGTGFSPLPFSASECQHSTPDRLPVRSAGFLQPALRLRLASIRHRAYRNPSLPVEVARHFQALFLRVKTILHIAATRSMHNITGRFCGSEHGAMQDHTTLRIRQDGMEVIRRLRARTQLGRSTVRLTGKPNRLIA